MRILHVLTGIDPELGGTVEAVRHLSIAMARRGAQVEVLSLALPKPEWMENWPVRLHALGRTASYYQYTPELVPWIRRNHSNYDAIVVHGTWRYPSLGVWAGLRGTQTPYFVFVHGMLDPWFRHAYPLKHVKKTLFWRLAEHRVFRDARAVLFTTEQERESARECFQPYRCREYVAGLGTAAPADDGIDTQRRAFYERFPYLYGKTVVLFVGRLHRVKGCDLLIRAFAGIARSDHRLHLVMAGPDEEGLRADLERLAASLQLQKQVTFTGTLEDQLKWGAFRSAEVFALPSHTESYGMAVVEAMACGVPVLISNRVNTWREIHQDQAGLVANDDLEGATDLLRRWHGLSPERKSELRSNAQRCFQQRFEIGRFTDNFINYLDSEIHGKSSASQAEMAEPTNVG